MKPPSGYYRQLIGSQFPEFRIAFTHTPIHGCKIVNHESVLQVLDKSTDPYAKFYSDGLRNGSLVTIVEIVVEKVYKNNGELYFTT